MTSFLLAAGLVAQAPGGPPPGAAPGGGILVVPTRVVFSDHKRTAAVSLTNSGAGQGSYRVSLVGMEMDEDGGCREVPLERAPGQIAIQDMIRFAPKEITLNPKESQLVRILVREPAGLPAGEYRLHMVFREVPPPPPEPGTQGAPKGISIRLSAVFGVAIPLIIRHGDTSAQVSLSRMGLDPEQKRLAFRLERQGNQSVYGDLKATFQSKSGKPRVLAEANGVSVFTPNAFRNMSMPLEPSAQGGRLGQGTIHVTYRTPEDQGSILLAEGTLEVR